MAFHPEFKSWSSFNLNVCQNMNMLRGSIQKKVGVAFSSTHGWGAYALEPIRKDEFVLEYTGELITDEEAERRGAIYDRKSVSYLFGVNSEYVVDAARKGNKAKFANHKAKEVSNLDVRIIASNGEHRIGLFASEAIEVGAELFFDYGYTHDSAPKWSQHDEPQPEKRAYDVIDDENEWEQWE
ncbi:Polycomb-like protein [Phytophthora palmivora]|uniref:Polycomb-like protein n=1 Tax=Phytophthora palmivora TaxID=4796 RepID=A0A2P4Y3M8_9STRA|nr:Polycomb-like protein [Phytophthora palmivora]